MSNLEQRLDNLESTVQRLERKIDRLLEMFGLEPSEDPDVKIEAEPPIVRRTLADVAADYPEVQAETVPVKQGWSKETIAMLKICEEMERERERLKPKIKPQIDWAEQHEAATKKIFELYGDI